MAETRKSLLEKARGGRISGSEYSRRLAAIIQAEQKAAAPKPKRTLLSATTSGVERKVEAGEIVPEKSTLSKAPAFAESKAVVVKPEAESKAVVKPEPKAISASEAGLIEAYEAGRITEEQYKRARGSMGLVEPEAEPKAVVKPKAESKAVVVEPEAEPKVISAGEAGLIEAYQDGRITEEEYQRARGSMGLVEPAPIVVESQKTEPDEEFPYIDIVGEDFTIDAESITAQILGTEEGLFEEGYVFDITSPTGFREEETGQVVPISVAFPEVVTPELIEAGEREKELKAIRAERDSLVDAAVRDMLSTGGLQTRGQGATVQFLRRPGSRQLAEDLLGFYGLFI